MSNLRLILGDQLSMNISSLSNCDKANDHLLMCEVWEEATYVKHHKKKIAFIFSAMRHFAQSLEKKGYQLHYTKLDSPGNSNSFFGEVQRLAKKVKPSKIIVTFPGEYRVWQDMQSWEKRLNIPVEIREDERFLCSRDEFKRWAGDYKQLRMEYFYREMRRKHDILMNNTKPEGGQWNYDSQNRKPGSSKLAIPKPHSVQPDAITTEVLSLVAEKFPQHFGDLEPFHYAVTRRQALNVLKHFIQYSLANFGDYQDAMLAGEPWMYHSHISFYLNIGLLEPMECISAVVQAYKENEAPLNAVEGFIRQIMGWREFIRGIYWLKMPDYASENLFHAKRDLPEFFWTGETELNCLKNCISETKANAYAHHIQRLMVLGNFLLLTGIDPAAVNEWYLIVYADAFEWVELPNVIGMILFADGGFFASKPYAGGGAYINKMSNYCKNCHYKVKEKNGDEACPFNYLYWNFLITNRDILQQNSRLGMMYRTIDKMSKEKIKLITDDAKSFLERLL